MLQWGEEKRLLYSAGEILLVIAAGGMYLAVHFNG